MHPRTRSRKLLIVKVAALLLLAFGAGSRLRALDATAMQAMVIVEGEQGLGSAFLVKMDGKTYLVTNSHVVRGNRNVKFKNLRNADIATGPLQIADNADAVRAEVAGATDALELDPDAEKIQIGDEVIVAGNAEGAGVVREIPGKVVGIGPDRIEVDAEFVPGNSGSPILLKSTGKVIGLATYAIIPRGGGAGPKSPLSLNEVRRFGYRLDTVEKWITPPSQNRLTLEGLKLAEMDNLMSSIVAVLNANAASVAKMGVSGFVTRERADQYPAFAALGMAIDDFAKHHAAAQSSEEKTRNALAFFARLKGITSDDVRGLGDNQFSGFYGVQLKETLTRFKTFYDWCDGTAMPAYRAAWLASNAEPRSATAGRSDNGGSAASAADLGKPLTAFLPGTKWYWEDRKDHVLEFHRDGKVELDFWRNFVTGWKVTGANRVTFTVLTGPNAKKTATIVLAEDRGSFTAVNFDDNRPILKSSRVPGATSSPAIEPAQLKLILTDQILPKEPFDRRHLVSYPVELKPASLEHIFWVIEDPQGKHTSSPMQGNLLPVPTTIVGTYHVYVEYRSPDLPVVISNVVGIESAGLVARAAGAGAGPAEMTKPFSEFLIGTKWLWMGGKDHVMEFQKGGQVELDFWRSMVTDWKVTGPNKVTFTILKGERAGRTATIVFTEDRSSFSGTGFDPKRVISASPRAPGDGGNPAPVPGP